MLAGVVDEIFGVGQLQLACAFVINMSGPINSPAIMPSQVSKAHSRTSPFALRQCSEKYCSPACRMQVLKQEKRVIQAILHKRLQLMWIESVLGHSFLACNLLWPCSLIETSDTELSGIH